MRRLSARYAGVCVGCGSSFGRGAEVWYVPAVRGEDHLYAHGMVIAYGNVLDELNYSMKIAGSE